MPFHIHMLLHDLGDPRTGISTEGQDNFLAANHLLFGSDKKKK